MNEFSSDIESFIGLPKPQGNAEIVRWKRKLNRLIKKLQKRFPEKNIKIEGLKVTWTNEKTE